MAGLKFNDGNASFHFIHFKQLEADPDTLKYAPRVRAPSNATPEIKAFLNPPSLVFFITMKNTFIPSAEEPSVEPELVDSYDESKEAEFYRPTLRAAAIHSEHRHHHHHQSHHQYQQKVEPFRDYNSRLPEPYDRPSYLPDNNYSGDTSMSFSEERVPSNNSLESMQNISGNNLIVGGVRINTGLNQNIDISGGRQSNNENNLSPITDGGDEEQNPMDIEKKDGDESDLIELDELSGLISSDPFIISQISKQEEEEKAKQLSEDRKLMDSKMDEEYKQTIDFSDIVNDLRNLPPENLESILSQYDPNNQREIRELMRKEGLLVDNEYPGPYGGMAHQDYIDRGDAQIPYSGIEQSYGGTGLQGFPQGAAAGPSQGGYQGGSQHFQGPYHGQGNNRSMRGGHIQQGGNTGYQHGYSHGGPQVFLER